MADTRNDSDAFIREIENRLLQGMFGTRTPEAVEASVTYARFLSTVGITPENYPVFLQMLEIENRWVIDALIGERDPFLILSSVQPNRYTVSRIFAMMMRWHKGSIYDKNLYVCLGVLQSVYSSPAAGYDIYPLSISDVNAIGKHLDKSKGQDEPINRAILEIIEKISELEDANDQELEEVSAHARKVRNAFFDDRKKMEDAIPPVLLVSVSDRPEVEPRGRKLLANVTAAGEQLAALEAAAEAEAEAAAANPGDGESSN